MLHCSAAMAERFWSLLRCMRERDSYKGCVTIKTVQTWLMWLFESDAEQAAVHASVYGRGALTLCIHCGDAIVPHLES